MLTRLAKSRVTRLLLSGGLMYFAFRRVDMGAVVRGLATVPWWFVLANHLFSTVILMTASLRWGWLLVGRVGFVDLLTFTKASFLGNYYSLFFPTGVAGDVFKWTSLQKRYAKLTRTQLFGSALIDRVVGFSTLCWMAFGMGVVGWYTKKNIPIYLLSIFALFGVGVAVFWAMVLRWPLRVKKTKYRVVNKLLELAMLLRMVERKRLILIFFASVVCTFMWIMQIYLISVVFRAPLGLMDSFIYLPVIGFILALPVSVAGFGAREHLYLLFFAQSGLSPENLLLISTFVGLSGILNSLTGGLLTLF